MNLTRIQKIWLYTRGGRKEKDILVQKGRVYVYMTDGRYRRKKVFLPTTDFFLSETHQDCIKNYDAYIKKQK